MKKLFYLQLVFLFSATQYAIADINDDLYAAVEAGDVGEVKRLLDAGADPNTALFFDVPGDGAGSIRPVLTVASIGGYPEIIRLLIDSGADIDALRKGTASHDTGLLLAIKGGNIECAKLLIEEGADITPKDLNRDTALTLVIPNRSNIDEDELNGRLEICRILIEAGADLDTTSYSGHTPLMLASKNGYADFIEHLTGSDLDRKDQFGRTAMILAADKGHTRVIECLLKAGADASVEDRFGYTALSLAQDKGYKEIVDLLTAAGAR